VLKKAPGIEAASGYRELGASCRGWSPGQGRATSPRGGQPGRRDAEIGAAVARARQAWPSRRELTELMSPSELAAVSDDRLLRALLESGCVPDKALERFLTLLRSAVLAQATQTIGKDAASPDELQLYSALARLCFVNDYVFDSTADEIELASSLRERLEAALQSGAAVPRSGRSRLRLIFPFTSYHALASSLSRPWPEPVKKPAGTGRSSSPSRSGRVARPFPC